MRLGFLALIVLNIGLGALVPGLSWFRCLGVLPNAFAGIATPTPFLFAQAEKQGLVRTESRHGIASSSRQRDISRIDCLQSFDCGHGHLDQNRQSKVLGFDGFQRAYRFTGRLGN